MAAKNNGPNWDAIRQEYIETDISMRKLAKKHGVNPNTLQSHSSTEKWSELRKEASRKAGAKLVQNAAKKRAALPERLDDVFEDGVERIKVIIAECKTPYEFEKAIAALERLYKIKGLDAASQLAAKKQQGGGADDTDTFNANILSIAELINHPMPDRTMEQVEAPAPEAEPKDGDGA